MDAIGGGYRFDTVYTARSICIRIPIALAVVRRYLKRLFVVSITGVIPIGIILAFKDPVAVMSASGIIAALHTPFIALAALYVNRTRLQTELRPGLFITLSMGAAGLFYLGFAGVYLWDLVIG